MPAELRDRRCIMPRGWHWACPRLRIFGYDKIFALDAGLDELNAIVLHQGLLYRPGTDRAHENRGTDRKRILTVSADAALPAVGAEVKAGATAVGEFGFRFYGSQGVRSDAASIAWKPARKI